MERIRQQKETVKTAAAGIGALLKLPRYSVLAAGFSLLFAIIIFFAINGNFYGPLFLSRLPIIDKLAGLIERDESQAARIRTPDQSTGYSQGLTLPFT